MILLEIDYIYSYMVSTTFRSFFFFPFLSLPYLLFFSSIMASSSTNDGNLSLNTILHMLTIKLSSTNYLLWKNQILPLLKYQNLFAHVNGESIRPSETITVEDKSSPNPLLPIWEEANHRALLIIQASLTEEAMSEVLGLTTAREV